VKHDQFPEAIRAHLIPEPGGEVVYRCLGCQAEHGIESLLYTCPDCGQVSAASRPPVRQAQGHRRRDLAADFRLPAHAQNSGRERASIDTMSSSARSFPLDAVVYLGEGHTPVVEANGVLQEKAGIRFFYKNDGQNPSASFKDRGMASALSYINFLIRQGLVDQVLSICASTGDTSAAAALYAAYLKPHIKSAVLLPHKKVTPQQLSQPLGSGADVFEIPGVFDDCMKVVEALSEQYNVALLNSKNAWRILGQESYSYEIAQDFDYAMADKVVVVPIGNAGNITAVMNGFLKFHETGIIDTLPKIVGRPVRSRQPRVPYYSEPEATKRKFVPMTVKPSVAQAAMIGNPVSMPRVIHLVERYNEAAGRSPGLFCGGGRTGHHGLAAHGQPQRPHRLHPRRRVAGRAAGGPQERCMWHPVKRLLWTPRPTRSSSPDFQDMYFQNSFPDGFAVRPNPALVNLPRYVHPKHLKQVPAPGKPLDRRPSAPS
jgi:threonine synthase